MRPVAMSMRLRATMAGRSATGTANINGHVWLTSGGNTNVSGNVSAQNADGSGGTITVHGPTRRCPATL